MNHKNKWGVLIGDPTPEYWKSYTKENMPDSHQSKIRTWLAKIYDSKAQATDYISELNYELWNYHVKKYPYRRK